MLYIVFTIICCLLIYIVNSYYIKRSLDVFMEHEASVAKHLGNVIDDVNKIKKDIYQ